MLHMGSICICAVVEGGGLVHPKSTSSV
jgi:hypothetical protein